MCVLFSGGMCHKESNRIIIYCTSQFHESLLNFLSPSAYACLLINAYISQEDGQLFCFPLLSLMFHMLLIIRVCKFHFLNQSFLNFILHIRLLQIFVKRKFCISVSGSCHDILHFSQDFDSISHTLSRKDPNSSRIHHLLSIASHCLVDMIGTMNIYRFFIKAILRYLHFMDINPDIVMY